MSEKVFTVKKNFISKKECFELIDFYNQNIQSSFQYRDTFPLSINFFHVIIERIEKICYQLDPNCKLDTQQIVRWPEGSKMMPHFDPKSDVFACLIYLNDDYLGGETCFEEKSYLYCKIKPEVGKLVIFSNGKILHWVNEVKKGTRYTLALWFVKK